LFVEVKRNKENINMAVLEEKARKLLQSQLKEYTPEFVGFSMDEM